MPGVAAVTLAQALQFYMPLLGLLGLAFWTGGLSQRVLGQERALKEQRAQFDAALKDQKAAQDAAVQELKRELGTLGADGELMVRLDERSKSQAEQLQSINRTLSGIQRTIANGMKTDAFAAGTAG